ncbi:MAG: acyl-CoA thioesterase [Alphaproteobacteria bacterium]|nr:acyl-CoA thioesterase [Alphaproteobacteria bacterium]
MADDIVESRSRYKHFQRIQTRWMDNDIYGHVNNVTYYSYFDTVVNEYLIRAGGLDIHKGAIVGFVVETSCRYRKPITFPDVIDAGLRVSKLGNSSVRCEIGIFRDGEDDAAAAGHFVHVYVDRAANRPVPIPPAIRGALEKLLVR